MSTVPFTMRLQEQLKRDLEAEAKRQDRPASYLATRAIREMLATETAKRRLIEEAIIQADNGEFISEKAMTRWFLSLGTEDELPEPESDVFINRT